jgi:predicted negative regulator of RcsB-dependent stress response
MCEWIAGRRGNPPQHATPVVKALAGTDIADVAAAFCDLQEARHRADYDHLAAFSKAAALGYVQDAEQAIAKLDAAPEAERQAFFSLVALRTGIR